MTTDIFFDSRLFSYLEMNFLTSSHLLKVRGDTPNNPNAGLIVKNLPILSYIIILCTVCKVIASILFFIPCKTFDKAGDLQGSHH